MPRRKLSEYRAKTIVNGILDRAYRGWQVGPGAVIPDNLDSSDRYVVKVDQAVKQRFKKGLIFLDIQKNEIPPRVEELMAKGYSYLLIEPFSHHEPDEERYISMQRTRQGVVLNYSRNGGVEIEQNADTIISVAGMKNLPKLGKETGLPVQTLERLYKEFDRLHLTLLEINPYVVLHGAPVVLDVAMEVDSSAELLIKEWTEADFRNPSTTQSGAEKDVMKLNKESPASFNLEVINPDGSIFLLLSGGGASVVIADEIYTLGHGDKLANYGEYSGNPTRDETRRYTENVVGLLLNSKAPKKVVLVGGAVANFTDISATFEGIIDVLEKHAAELKKQGAKFYVRRGGPRQAAGLKRIDEVLHRLGLWGGVYDPKVSIPEAVGHMIAEVA